MKMRPERRKPIARQPVCRGRPLSAAFHVRRFVRLLTRRQAEGPPPQTD